MSGKKVKIIILSLFIGLLSEGAAMVNHIHNGINYIEFTVTDLDKAKAFYSSAFGWNLITTGQAMRVYKKKMVKPVVCAWIQR